MRALKNVGAKKRASIDFSYFVGRNDGVNNESIYIGSHGCTANVRIRRC